MRNKIIGVMGPGEGAQEAVLRCAWELGRLIAEAGWITLSGGRNQGVMDAVSRGAREGGGVTIGILPSDGVEEISEAIDIPILTGLGRARNVINVLSSNVVVGCGISSGAASEIALALNANKPVILLAVSENTRHFFSEIGGSLVHCASTPAGVIDLIHRL